MEQRYQDIFEGVPVSIWEEDWSGVKEIVEHLTGEGVTDLGAYLGSHSDCLEEMVERIKVLDVNQATMEIFGAADKTVFFRKISNIVTPNLQEVYIPRITSFASGITRIVSELTRCRLDGSTFDARVTAELSGRHLDSWRQVYVVVEDISEQKRSEQFIRQAQKMEAVGQITGGVAHDFNNILAVILGNMDLLLERLDRPERCRDLAARAIRAAERGQVLTQRLLAFSRKQPLSPRATDLNRLLGGMSTLLHQALGEQNDLRFIRPGDLWHCEVDHSQVENSILNLAINARDAMPGGGKLTVETANVSLDDDYAAAQIDVTPGHYVMMAVADTGSGMSEEVRARAFEPFFTTKDVGKGTGLGLSMVYGFVKQSHGHISIYSEIGEGTTVKIYLPRAAADEEDDAGSSEPAVGIDGRGRSVLVVEDEQLLRELTEDLLEGLGFRVATAGTGPAALEVLESMARIDLLLTDAVLPGGMNGRQLAEAVTGRRPETKVLYMSGYTKNAIVHHGRLDRDAVLLQKPFRKQDLMRKIGETLGETQGENARIAKRREGGES